MAESLAEALEAAFAANEPDDPLVALAGWALGDRQELARLIAAEPGGPTYPSAMRRLQRYITRSGEQRGRRRPPRGLAMRMALAPFRRHGARITFTGRVYVASGRYGDCRTRTVRMSVPASAMGPVVDAWVAGDELRAAELFEEAAFDAYGLAGGAFGCPDEPDDAVDDLEVEVDR